MAQISVPTKTFQKNGKWIEKPLKTKVLICTCGNKYVKTRNRQTKCIPCIYKEAAKGRK